MIARLFVDMGAGPGALLVLLLVGHVLGDFLFQTKSLAEKKEEHWGPLLLHGAIVLGLHVAVLSPFITQELAVGLVVVAAVHTILDAVRSRAFGDWGSTVNAFLLDQGLHVLVILVFWGFAHTPSGFRVVRWLPSSEWVSWYARWLGIASGYVFVAGGGARIVRGVLDRFKEAIAEGEKLEQGNAGESSDRREKASSEELAKERERRDAMGRPIGYMERLAAITLILLGQWAGLGLIVAAKSIARFPDLEDKPFAEYYLLGTLTSLLVAMGVGILLRMLLQ